MRSANTWDALVAWYDEKQDDEGDPWHRGLIDPPVLQFVGSVAGLRVLDLACGNGYLARRFARTGARVTGVDASLPIIERARRREAEEPLGIVYHVGGAERLDMLEEASFDVVVCNMALMDIENAAGAISETARVLHLGGRLVVSLSHPCFDIPNASAWVVERIDLTTTIWRKVSRYREFFVGLCPWRIGASQIVHTPAYHRPLSWYFQSFRATGFVVTMLAEPEPSDEFVAGEPQGRWIAQIPLHCVIEARRDR